MTAQDGLWALAATLLAAAVIAGIAEHRRAKRRNLDKPGFMPWALIQVLAGIGSVIAAALALRG
jgi:hypothetical protein